MTLRQQLEAQILLNKQLNETNKRLGDDVVRLQDREVFLKDKFTRAEDRHDFQMRNLSMDRDNYSKQYTKLKKKYKLARQFIQSINKV